MRAPVQHPGARLISEDELKTERERWRQTVMHEVWNLENAAFERINAKLEESKVGLVNEVTKHVASQVLEHIEAERTQRTKDIEDLRQLLLKLPEASELGELKRSFADLQATVATERQSVTSEATISVEGSSKLESTVEELKVKTASLEAAMTDLKGEMALQLQRQEMQVATSITELHQEIGALNRSVPCIQVSAANESTEAAESNASLITAQAELLRQFAELEVSVAGHRDAINALKEQEKDLQSKASHSEVEALQEQVRSLRAAAQGRGELELETSVSKLPAYHGDLDQLSKALAEERSERCAALAEVNRLMESIAKAASASIEETEKRLESRITSVSSDHGMNLGLLDMSIGAKSNRSVASGRQTPAGHSTASQEVGGHMNSGLAKLVGEMDAELRMELNSRLRMLNGELKSELMKEVAVRCAAVEARCGAVEADLRAKLGGVTDELQPRLKKLEAMQLPTRVQNLEQEVKRTSYTLGEAMSERGRTSTQGNVQRMSSGSPPAVTPGRSLSRRGLEAAGAQDLESTVAEAVRKALGARPEMSPKRPVSMVSTQESEGGESAMPRASIRASSPVVEALSTTLKESLEKVVTAVTHSVLASQGNDPSARSPYTPVPASRVVRTPSAQRPGGAMSYCPPNQPSPSPCSRFLQSPDGRQGSYQVPAASPPKAALPGRPTYAAPRQVLVMQRSQSPTVHARV